MSICLRSYRNLFTTHSKWRNKLLHRLKKGFQDEFPDVRFDWNSIYSLSFKVSLETKIREFQYKVLNNIVFTNEKLFKIKMTDSPQCTFCKNEIESLEHLFYSCEITRSFWEAPRSYLWNVILIWNLRRLLMFSLVYSAQEKILSL